LAEARLTERRARSEGVERVAVISMHTCPLDQPGTGDSGGMNVYVRSVASRLAERGVRVDVFTRAAGPEQHVVSVDHPGVRVVHLEAGPNAPVEKEELPQYLPAFVRAFSEFEAAERLASGRRDSVYDVVHTHYWLSGWAGIVACERLDVPLVHSFHTLGAVKNRSLGGDERPEPASRLDGEERIVRGADCILAPTAGEAADLVSLYGASPDRISVVPPGVDTDRFRPGDSEAARRALGLQDRSVVLFAGRLQSLKRPDLAIRTIAVLAAQKPEEAPRLLILGGPSGRGGVQPESLAKLAADLGVAHLIDIHDPVPHALLSDYYRAADVVIVPSRTESFGLVALEAEACGTPVVASDVGGLRTAVSDGVTGTLVASDAPEAFAAALGEILGNEPRRRAMGDAGARFARRYDWRRAAEGLLEVYESLLADPAARDLSG
jgi:D-inositol-3-phosphate glycosyltransferase